MKFTKICLVCMGALALFGCNMGNTTTDNSNGVVITIANSNACKTISPNGGQCTLNITYYASNSTSTSIGQFLQLSLPNLYTSNITSQCSSGAGAISTTSKSCTITITSQTGAQTSQPQTGQIYPANMSSNFTSFIVGGGA